MNKGDKKKEKQLQQQALQQQAQFNQQLAQATQPSALELAQQKELTDWKAETTGPGFDIMKTTAMNPYLQLYNNAVSQRQGERGMGQGLVTMGQAGSNPNLMGMIDRLNAERRREAAGGALENAFRIKDAQVRGDVMPLLAHQQQRGLSLASLTGNMANSAASRWAGYTPRPGFFNQLGSATAAGIGNFIGSGAGFKGWSFDRGGNLSRYMRRPGDRALLGETGPEVAEVDERGDIQIAPLPGRPQVFRAGEGRGPITLEDLYALAHASGDALRQSPQGQQPAPADAPLTTRPRLALPPPPVAPPSLVTGPGGGLPPDLGLAGDAPPVPTPRVGLVGYDVDPRTAGMGERPRVANPLEYATERYKASLVAPPPADRDGGWKSFLKGAGRGFLQDGIGGAIVQGARHAADPSANERDAQTRMVARDAATVEGLQNLTEGELGLQGKAEDVRYKHNLADFTGERGQIERDKARALAQSRQQTQALRLLGTLKGQNVDPANPAHAQIIQALEAAGIPFDPMSHNNAASNLVPVELIDPDNPTQKRRAFYNKVTGDVGDSFQSGYVQPVGQDGLTEAQRRADAARQAGIEDRRKLLPGRLQQLELDIATKRRELSQGIPASAARAFSAETATLSAQLTQKRQQIAALRKSALELTADPVEAEERADKLEAEANEIIGRIEAARSKALSGGGGVAAGAGGAAPVGRVSRKNFGAVRAQNPSLQGKSDAEVERALRAQGVVVY